MSPRFPGCCSGKHVTEVSRLWSVSCLWNVLSLCLQSPRRCLMDAVSSPDRDQSASAWRDPKIPKVSIKLPIQADVLQCSSMFFNAFTQRTQSHLSQVNCAFLSNLLYQTWKAVLDRKKHSLICDCGITLTCSAKQLWQNWCVHYHASRFPVYLKWILMSLMWLSLFGFMACVL